MFKLWGKIIKSSKIKSDMTVESTKDDTRTHLILDSLDQVCHNFNLSKPIWLDSNILEFKKRNKTRFTEDNFVDSIDFDYLEIEIIEE